MSQQINLFNPDFRRQKNTFSVTAIIQAQLLIVIGAGLFYGYAAYQITQLEKQSAETDRRYAKEKARLTEYEAQYSPQQSSQLLQEELKQTEARAAAQIALVETLKSGALGNTTGYSEYMRAFARQVVNGLWLTGFDIVGDAAQMSMSGGVLSPDLLPAYVKKLGQEKVMHGKSFAAIQMEQPKSGSGKAAHYVEFTLQSTDAGTDNPGETKPGETKTNEMLNKLAGKTP